MKIENLLLLPCLKAQAYHYNVLLNVQWSDWIWEIVANATNGRCSTAYFQYVVSKFWFCAAAALPLPFLYFSSRFTRLYPLRDSATAPVP
jgi:hypothetical protein